MNDPWKTRIGLRPIGAYLAFMRDLVVDMNAQTVVELGVNVGDSTLALLSGVAETDGHLCSCDMQDYPQTRRVVEGCGLAGHWTYIVDDCMEWGKTWRGPAIDLLLQDALFDAVGGEAALKIFAPLIRPSGKMLLHGITSPEHRGGVLAGLAAFMETESAKTSWSTIAPPLRWTVIYHVFNHGMAELTRT